MSKQPNEGTAEMTLLVTGYTSKKKLKAAVGQPLKYVETSLFGPEYKADGSFLVAHLPALGHNRKGREFFARVIMKDGKISKVE